MFEPIAQDPLAEEQTTATITPPLSPSPAPPLPSATADTLPPRETDALDLTFGAAIPKESEAFAAYHALKQERRAPGTVPADRIPALKTTLRDYATTARAYNRPLFAEQTTIQRAKQTLHTQKLLAGLDKLPEVLSPEQVKALDERAKLHPDPDAYRARQINRALLDMAYGKKVKPESYEMARDHYAKTVLGSTTPLDDKAFYSAMQGRAQKQQGAEKLLGEKLESLLSDTVSGKLRDTEAYIAEVKESMPDLDDTTLENIGMEMRLKRRQFRELKRTVEPIAKALTAFTFARGDRADAITPQTTEGASPIPQSEFDAAQRFMALTPEQRTMTAAIIAQQVESMPEDQRPAALRAALGAGRTFHKGVQNLADFISANYYSGKQFIQGDARPEGDSTVQGAGQLRQLSTKAAADMLRPSDSFLAKTGILAAAQVPYLFAAASGAGTVLMGASMAGDSYVQARLDQPNADPSKQLMAATVSGAAQAVVERASFKVLTGAVKGTGKLTGFLTGKYGTESALRLAGVTNSLARYAAGYTIGTAVIGATEYGEEVAQEFINTGLQDLATTMSGIDPDTDYLALLKSWDPRGEKGAKTILALLPLALIGGLGAGAHHFKHGELLLRNRAALTAVGIAPDRIDAIASNPDIAAATQEFQSAFLEGATAKIKEAEATRRANAAAAYTEHLDGVQALAKAAGFEIIAEDTDFADMGEEPRFVLRLPEQEPQLFNTREEAETALKETLEQQIQDAHDIALESLTGSMVDFLTQEYASGQNVQVSQKNFAGDFDTLIKKGLATREQVQARLELFALEQGITLPQLQANIAAGKTDLRIMARAYSKQLTGGATKYFVDIFQGADPLAAAEDFSETHWQHLISSGMVDAFTAIGWLKEAEEKTGYAYLPSTLTAQTYTPAQRMALIEGLSKASVQYLLGQSTSEQLPEGFRGWLEKMVIAMGQAWTWAKQLMASGKLREAIENNQLPARFVAELADSVGLNDAARQRRAEKEAEAQAMAEFMGDFTPLSTFAKGKLLHPAKAREMESPFAGELQRIYDHFVSRERKVTHNKKGVKVDYKERTAAANKFFAPVDEAVNLDDLRARMTQEGFPNMETISDMLLQIEEVLSIDNYEIYATHSSLAAQNAAEGYGPTFSMAGTRAHVPQFMRDSLSAAQDMAADGKDPETIRALTGWHPGKYDGRMRWEIPDNKAIIRGEGTAQEIVDRYYPIAQQRDANLPAPELQDILRHPALFDAYPSAKNISILADANTPYKGTFSPREPGFPGPVITLNANLKGDAMRSTLLHEIQHFIQETEGFARGSSIEEFIEYDMEGLQAENEKYASAMQSLIKRYKEEGKSPSDAFSSPQGKIISDSLIKIQDALRAPQEKYKRTAGEIEARDTQARRDLTPEQRKAIAPYSSENIAPESAIVLYGERIARAIPLDLTAPVLEAQNATITGPTTFSIAAYHGTPHKVDKFTTAKIGTGEGAQAYGWGLYFAQAQEVGEGYRKAGRSLGVIKDSDGKWWTTDGPQPIAGPFDSYTDAQAEADAPSGNLYTVTLNVKDEDLLDWDKPLSEQSEKVQKILISLTETKVQQLQKSNPFPDNKMTDQEIRDKRFGNGSGYYKDFSLGKDSEKSASLLAAGIRGIRYLDGNSRSDGQGSYNYVIFDEADIQITEENGQPVTMEEAITFSMSANQSLLMPRIDIGMDSETEIADDGEFKTFMGDYSTSSKRYYRFVKTNEKGEIISAMQVKMDGPRSKKGTISAIYTEPQERRKGHAASLLRYAQKRFTIKHSADVTADGKAFKKADGITYSLSALTGSPLHTLLAQKAAAGPTERAEIMEGIRTRLQALEYKLEARGSGELTEMEKQLLGWRARTDLTPEQRERLRIEDALAQVKAVLQAVPVEIRAKIAVPMARILDAQTDKTTINAFAELIENLDEELEFHLRGEYTEAISRILDIAQPTMSESRQSKGKLIIETNRIIARITDIQDMDARQIALELQLSEARLASLDEELNDVGEDAEARAKVETLIQDAREDQMLLYHFGGIGSKDSRELFQTLKILRQIYSRGRYARNIMDNERRQWLRSMRTDIKSSLEAPRGVTGPEHARATEKKKDIKGYGLNLMSIHNLLSRLFPFSRFATEASQRLIDAQRRTTRARLAAKDRFENFLITRMDATTRRERNSIIRALHKRRHGWGEVREMDTLKKEKLTIDQVQRILAGTLKPGWETEKDTMILLQQAWRDYMAKPKNRRDVAIERLGPIMNLFFEEVNERDSEAIMDVLKKNYAWAQTVEKIKEIYLKTKSFKWTFTEADLLEMKQQWEMYHRSPKSSQDSTKFIEITRVASRKAPTPLYLSDMDALYVLQLSKQEEYIPALATHGYTAEVLAEIRRLIDPRAIALGEFYAAEYDANWAEMNPTFQAMYQMDMPRIRNYAPGMFDNMQDTNGISGDPMGDGKGMSALSFGSTKNRRAHRSRPKQYSAHAVWMSHVDRSTYWTNFAEIARDMSMILRETEVRRAIEAKHGMEASAEIKVWIENINNDGAVDGAARLALNVMAQKVVAGQSIVALAANFGVPFKQFSAMLGSMWKIGPTNAMRAFARAIFRPETFNYVWKSEAVQQRIREGFSPEDRSMLDAAEMNPQTLWSLHQYSRLPTVYADAFFTTLSGVIAYDHHYTEAIKGQLDPARAHDLAMQFMDSTVFLTSQPADTQTRSNMEIHAKDLGKLFSLFRSDPRKQMGNLIEAYAKTKQGRMSKSEFAQMVATQWMLYGVLSYIGGAAFRAIAMDDDDDRAVFDWKDLLVAMLIGPVEGAGLLGGIIQSGIKLIAGSKNYGDSMNPVADMLEKSVRKVTSDDFTKNFDPFDIGDYASLTASLGMLASMKNPLFALVPATIRGAGQIQDALDNISESEDERLARLAREYNTQQRDAAKTEARRIDDLAESGTPLDQIPEEDRKKVEKKRITAQEEDTAPPLIQSLKKMSERTRTEKINYILENLPDEDERASFKAMLRTHGIEVPAS